MLPMMRRGRKMLDAITNRSTAANPSRTTALPSGGTGFAAAFRSVLAGHDEPATGGTTRHEGKIATDDADRARLDEAVAAFKKELSLTPAQRVRRDVLKIMDLTEEAIEALPPKERVEAEQKVAMEVARRMKTMQGGAATQASMTSLPD
ncbi:hypothetical protein ASE90_16335 [Sphingomonas sp. Leaf67]|nr:hypothetical protein ASE90_16335 [Sphingomonas sp. Leaf67]